VTTKWVFKQKFKANGSLECYKARWVLRGFTQRPGIDFDETYICVYIAGLDLGRVAPIAGRPSPL
jgi:hypothetical protein